jgi:hypothetical protein
LICAVTLVAAIVLLAQPVQAGWPVPPARSCMSDADPKRLQLWVVHAEWMRLGGPNGPMGCPQAVNRDPSGLVQVAFENGMIVVNPRIWANGVLAAFQRWNEIVVDWAIDIAEGQVRPPGTPPPLHFDKFLLRWQHVGSGSAGQIDVHAEGSVAVLDGGKYTEETHLRTRGHRRVSVGYAGPGPATYTVAVKGCDVGTSSRCPQDWLGPAAVVMITPPPGPMPVDLGGIPAASTVEQSRDWFPRRAAAAVLQAACGRILPWSVFRNEADAAMIVLAKMAYAKLFASDRCPGRDVENRREVADWLLQQRVESASGTSIDGMLGVYRTGEYDVAMTGWIALLYAFGDELPKPVFQHVLTTLLNKRGPVDPSDHTVTFLAIPETENHILMIETSRYLTNQLLCEHRLAPPNVCDNGQNGMTAWMLGHLRRVLAEDFIEYHANPYQDYSLTALLNLYSYARDERVKTAAQMVLDYVFLKAAVSSDDLRRSVPFRRKASYWDKFFLGGPHPDPIVGFLLQLAGNHGLLGQFARQEFAWEMVWAAVSEYRLPPLVLDVVVNRGARRFYQTFRHHTTEIYFGSPSYTISAGGLATNPAYPVFGGKPDDRGIAVLTLLLPRDRVETSFDEALRFVPRDGEVYFGNVCVAPHFACGSRISIPSWLLPRHQEGPWKFYWVLPRGAGVVAVATKKAPRGYFLAIHDGPEVGFFEAYDQGLPGNDLSFDRFVSGVKERNGRTTFQPDVTNRYVTTDGTVIEFFVSRLVLGVTKSEIVSINGVKPGTAFAAGSMANTDGRVAFLRIRHPDPQSRFGACELLLDFRNAANPVRQMSGPALCTTGEGRSFAEYKPCTPIVFVPAPDAPADRLSQAWGDRGFSEQDRINVRIREAPPGSGQFDVRVREATPRGPIEVSAEKVRVTEAPTSLYGGPVYDRGLASPGRDPRGPYLGADPRPAAPTVPSDSTTSSAVPGWRTANAGKLGERIAGTPAPPREPGGSPGGARPGEAVTSARVPAGVKLFANRVDRSLGLDLDKGIRLEVDILCDERLSPRVYQVRYLRFLGSGEKVVDVMLKFSQPAPR